MLMLIHQKIYIAFLKICDVGGEGSVFGQVGFLRLKRKYFCGRISLLEFYKIF